MKKMKKKVALGDAIVVYHSSDDECWIAHSLKTDQIGTGERIVDALADAIKAVHQICAAAAEDPTRSIFRDAPAEIIAMAEEAKPLPREIYEIAHKMVHGAWPAYLSVDFQPRDDDGSFKTDVPEPVCS